MRFATWALGLSLLAPVLAPPGARAQATDAGLAPAVNEEQQRQAFLLANGCSNAVFMEGENLYIGFGNYLNHVGGVREPVPSHFDIIHVTKPDQRVSLATQDGVVGFQVVGTSLYVLTYSALEEWDLATFKRVATYPTYKIERDMKYKEHATGLVYFDGKLFLSHGRLGISVFDVASKSLVKQERLVPGQWPLESQAVDITRVGTKALIAMDNFSLVREGAPPFRGFVVYDLPTMSVDREVPGLDPGATSIVSDGRRAVIGFDGPIWKFDVATILSSAKAAPMQLVWKYPLQGHPIGKPFMTSRYLFTCFLKAPSRPGEPFKKVPEVLLRKDLKLD